MTKKNKGFLQYIEIIGNKLPHPYWMFIGICALTIVVSFIAQKTGLRVVDPGSGITVEAVNLLSAEGLRQFVQEVVKNFAYFAPFGLVLVMLMGVSIAEKSGFLPSVMKGIAFSVHDKVVIPIVFILGACGNIGSDAGVVIIPPIAALVFAKMGKNPIAGLVVGYAGATAGFSANLLIAGTDVLLAGISTEVAQNIGNGIEVSATANWYFMIVSTFVLAIAGTVVAMKFTIPKCEEFKIEGDDALSASEENGPKRLTAIEKKRTALCRYRVNCVFNCHQFHYCTEQRNFA